MKGEQIDMLKKKLKEVIVNREVARWLQKLDCKEWSVNEVLNAYFAYLASMHIVVNDSGKEVAKYAQTLSLMTNNQIRAGEIRVGHCKTQLKLIIDELNAIASSVETTKLERKRLLQEIAYAEGEYDALCDNPKWFRFRVIYSLIICNWDYINKDYKYRMLADLVAMDEFFKNEELEDILKEMLIEVSQKW